MSTGFPARLRALLEPVVARTGCDLEAVEVTPAGRRRVVRVVVDRDGGVSLDDAAAVSTAVSGRLEDTDALGASPYVLEVTSPGVDRPLTAPRHWRRAVGRLVTAALATGGEVRGRVVAADADAVVFAADEGDRRVPTADLRSGRVELEFRRADDAESDDAEPDDAEPDDADEAEEAIDR